MRIHKVTMTGFGPYKETEVVNFDDFEADGIFLISGKTGAGKTSILDAVTFALYGCIPRYDGSAGEKVRSDHIGPADRCEVALEFTVGEVRYRVTRSPECQRPKQRGEGFTTEHARAEIALWDGSVWVIMESQVQNVARRIDEVVHLNASQFQQVILLAQGRFQEFLVANSDQRRELLRTLFGTKRFADYSDLLDDRARTLKGQLAKVAAETRADVESLTGETGRVTPETLDVEAGVGVVEWANRLVVDQSAAVAETQGEEKLYRSLLDDATELHDQAKSVADRQRRRALALARQTELATEAALIADARARLELATRADLTWPALKRHDDAESDRCNAADAEEVAQREFRIVRAGAPEELTALDLAAEGFTEAIGSLRGHHKTEQSLPGLRAKAEQADAALVDFDAQSEGWIARREELRLRIAALEEELPKLEAEAGLLPEAKAGLDKLSGRLAAAQRTRSPSSRRPSSPTSRPARTSQRSPGRATP